MTFPVTNAAAFDREVLKSDKPVLCYFHSNRLADQQTEFTATINTLAASKGETLKVVTIDIDHATDVPMVKMTPTLMLYKNGERIDRVFGAKPLAYLDQWIDDTIATSKRANTRDKTEEEEIKKALSGFSRFLNVTIGMAAGIPSALTALGGTILAATAATPVIAALGFGAAAIGAYSLYKTTTLIMNIPKFMENLLEKSAEEKATGKDIRRLVNGMTAMPKWMQLPIVRTAMSGVTLAAGIALWPVGGFIATAASVWMTVGGLAGTAINAIFTLGKGPFWIKDAEKKPAATQSLPAPAPSTTSSPATKLDDMETRKGFNNVADKPDAHVNTPVEKPAADNTPKPPKA